MASIDLSYSFVSTNANATNAVNVKASAGVLYVYDFGNNGAADAYVKLYDSATAPTTGSGTPKLVIYVPKGGRAQGNCNIGFTTGIGHAITGGAANSDTTAVATSQVLVNLEYF